MNWFLVVLLVAAMAATAYVLARGVITMAQGKELSSEQQQQWMRKRVQFQAVAIILVVLLLLVAGSRVSKSSLRMTAIGEVDEANSAVGVAIPLVDHDVGSALRMIQNELF